MPMLLNSMKLAFQVASENKITKIAMPMAA
jgi:hypothetical protein